MDVESEMQELEKAIQKDVVERLWARFYNLHDKRFAVLRVFRLRRLLKKLREIHGKCD